MSAHRAWGVIAWILTGIYLWKVIGYDEGIKLVSTDGKVIITILGYVDRITLGIDVGT